MKKYLLNSISGIAQIFIVLLLSIIAIPQLISKFGTEFYGVLSLALVVGNINTFINLGFNASLIKYLTEQGKCSQSDIDIVSVSLFLAILIIPISILVIYFNQFILLRILYIPPVYVTSDLLWLFNLLVVSNIFVFLTPVLTAILDSLQKIYITNGLQSIYNIFNWGLLLLIINLTDNIIFIGVSYLAPALIWFGCLVFFARKSWGKLNMTFSIEGFRNSLKKQLSYGLKIYAGGIINFFSEPFTKIIISHFFGLNIVGAYDIALKIKGHIINVFFKIYYPLYPYIGQINDKSKLRDIIHIIEQKAYFISAPIIAFIIFAFPPLIDLWFGQNNNINLITPYIIIISSGYMAFSVNMNPIYFYLIIKGHPEKTIIAQTAFVIINGGLLLAMCYFGNLYAPAISNFTGILSGFIILIYYQHKYLNSLIFDNVCQILKILVLFISLCIVSFFISSQFEENIFKIIILFIATVLLSAFLYRRMRVFVQDDINKYIPNAAVNKLVSKALIRN